jgi:CubicO group peptidase (beta-lactamase class C family)
MARHAPPQTAAELGLMPGGRPAFDRLVTLANWQDPPFNRWAYQHFRELVPTARVDRGTGPVTRLPRETRDLDGLRFAAAGGETTTLAALLAATYTDAFLVLHHGRVVFEQYFNGMTPATPHLLQSVSKSITGTLAGIMTARGELDPGELVTAYVPELAGTSWDGARLREVLDMRTGTRFSEDYADLKAEVRQYEQVVGWRPQTDPQTADDLYSYIAGLENVRPHGGAFDYRSILTDLLGWIIEAAGRDRFADLLSRDLWARIGAERDAEVAVDGHGHPVTDGGISVTLRDLARFGQCHVAKGRCAGRRVIPASWIDDSWRGNDETRIAFAGAPQAERFPGGLYRNQWWAPFPSRAVLLGSGIYGQSLYIDLAAEAVIVKFSTWPEALDLKLADMHLRAFEAVVAALRRAAA